MPGKLRNGPKQWPTCKWPFHSCIFINFISSDTLATAVTGPPDFALNRALCTAAANNFVEGARLLVIKAAAKWTGILYIQTSSLLPNDCKSNVIGSWSCGSPSGETPVPVIAGGLYLWISPEAARDFPSIFQPENFHNRGDWNNSASALESPGMPDEGDLYTEFVKCGRY